MSALLDTLGTSVLPSVMSSLAGAGLTDTMSVSRTAQTADGMGGFTDGTVTTPYTSIPVSIRTDKGTRYDTQGKPITAQTYTLEFPTVTSSGTLISVNLATDKLVVDARSPFPARTFLIISPANDSEVINQFICIEES